MRRLKAVVVAVAVTLVFSLLANARAQYTKAEQDRIIKILGARINVCEQALRIMADNIRPDLKSKLRMMQYPYPKEFGEIREVWHNQKNRLTW